MFTVVVPLYVRLGYCDNVGQTLLALLIYGWKTTKTCRGTSSFAGQRCAHSLECEAGLELRGWLAKGLADGSRCGQGMFMWKWYLGNRGKCQIDLNQLCCRQVAEKVTNDKAWVSICPIFTGNLGRFYVFLVFGVLTRFHIVSIIDHFSLLTYSVPTLKPKHLNTQDGHPISKYFQISLDLWLMIDFISHSSAHSRTASETVLLSESIAGGGLWCSQWAWWWPVEVCEGCRVGQKEARREVLHW